MAVPKRRHSRSRTRKRRSHDALKAPGLSLCADCGEPKQPHRLCASCGKYKGRTVFSFDADLV
ncbi:MAG: 50S ribosomal protein L32 [Desulfobulbaceae bacterium]|uniref:Large ribosomal subunit protein bL32 n=1 Tax=Candidatus Desulfatifera sulfidica TaxID=2841691 RepID=A0A8J6NA15_9BACT|nr:50S ribosomal protein L32 [Candidatus Desulfatifera sulfidica]